MTRRKTGTTPAAPDPPAPPPPPGAPPKRSRSSSPAQRGNNAPPPPPPELLPQRGDQERRAELDALEREVDALERAACRTRLEPFLFRYLPEAFDRTPGAFHRGIYADVERLLRREEVDGAVRQSAAYAYPRGHGKTTTIVLGALLWVIAEWRNMAHFGGKPPFILIVSDTFDQARDRALDLRDQIEGNARFIRDYGMLAPDPAAKTRRKAAARRGQVEEDDDDGGRWTNADWTTTTGVRVKAVGAAMKVRGLLRAGRRPTLIVCDDLENDQAVSTEAQRSKLLRWFTRALIPTGIAGRLLTLVVGTILHADSLLSRLLSADHFGGWLKRRFAALYNAAGLPDAEGTIPLWPDGWPLEALRYRRDEIGSVAFAQEYLNIPIDDDAASFRREWLDVARNRGRGIPFLYNPPPVVAYDRVVATWDCTTLAGLAGVGAGAYQAVVTAWDIAIVESEKEAKKRDTDWTVGTTVGLTLDDRFQVRRIFRARGMTPAAFRARVMAEQAVTGASYIVVENNAAQKIHQIELTGQGLPIVGHTTGRQKHSAYEGVPALALLFETGRIDLCAASPQEDRRIDQLVTELHGLGVEAHDDMPMSLWMAVYALRRWMARRDRDRTRLIGPDPKRKAAGRPEDLGRSEERGAVRPPPRRRR